MKSIVCLLLLFYSVSFSFAQEQIKVKYINQVSYEISEDQKKDKFSEALEEAMKEVHEYALTIDGHESTFKKIPKINNKQQLGGIRISFGMPDSNLYKDVENKIYIETTHHDGYLEKDSLTPFDWQLTREKSKILNYDVRKAVYTDSLKTVEAWYAPGLTFKTGPDEYWGLPGLILKVEIVENDIDSFREYFLANEIEIMEEKEPLDIPNDGEMVSAEKIDELNEKQMQFYNDMRSQDVDTSD